MISVHQTERVDCVVGVFMALAWLLGLLAVSPAPITASYLVLLIIFAAAGFLLVFLISVLDPLFLVA